MGIKITYDAFNKALKVLSKKYLIVAPAAWKGKGAFSDTDIIGYGRISSFEDMALNQKSRFSPKEYIFPIRETLFKFENENIIVPPIDDKEIIIFLRPCDINGIKRLDAIFLKNGSQEDFYYKRLRQKVRFFMIECLKGFDSCFCVSMESNRSDDYSCAFRFDKNEILVEVKDSAFKEVFSEGSKIQFKPEFIKENKIKINIPPQADLCDKKIFEHPVWQQYTKRCIACGRCNVSCITCSCFTSFDTKQQDGSACRKRVWASCHLDGFCDMAGGHSFRKIKGERMRFKTMHKINDFHRRFGFNMCVGCGRCEDVCPEYISFAKCIEKLNKVLMELQ